MEIIVLINLKKSNLINILNRRQRINFEILDNFAWWLSCFMYLLKFKSKTKLTTLSCNTPIETPGGKHPKRVRWEQRVWFFGKVPFFLPCCTFWRAHHATCVHSSQPVVVPTWVAWSRISRRRYTLPWGERHRSPFSSHVCLYTSYRHHLITNVPTHHEKRHGDEMEFSFNAK